ncbi:MAG: hypothetical protein CMG62_07995 [Candidatus Marinimicrobia bacterium]|nr:hypothetical protein [Candidatus Neomarinimicrobiota bacterium]
MNKVYNLSTILFILAAFFGWREYEKYVRKEYAENNEININKNYDPLSQNRIELERMAEIERNKIKVMVEHDNRPETNTYPMILDASRSYDPDLGDKVSFKWVQKEGPPIEFLPNNNSSKVSFEGVPGLYSFELTVSDEYGAGTTIIKTVEIANEPNYPPIIDIEIRQGSELK